MAAQQTPPPQQTPPNPPTPPNANTGGNQGGGNQAGANQGAAGGDVGGGGKPPFQFDEYWLERGKKFADETLSTLAKTMQSYLIFINSLLGVSFLGGVAIATYLTTDKWWIYLFFALPIALLIRARWKLGVELSAPEYQSPDLRSPIQINKAFNSIVNARRKELIKARELVATTVFAFIVCIPIGVFLFNKDKADKDEAAKAKPIPEYVYIDNQDKAIVVKAKLSNVADLQVHLIGLNSTTKKMDTIVSHVYKNEQGEITASYYKKRLIIKVSQVNLTYPKGDYLETYQFMIEKEAKKEDKKDTQGKISNEDILKNQRKI